MSPFILIAILLAWQVVVFAFYAEDKRRAVAQKWRIPEKTLILLSILAGGLGALTAGKVLHHKTRKGYFWVSWIVGLVVFVAVLGLILWLGTGA